MNSNSYLKVSGSLFALITLGQLTRLTLQIPVQIDTWVVPMWPSLIVAAVALAMCIWAFRSLRSA